MAVMSSLSFLLVLTVLSVNGNKYPEVSATTPVTESSHQRKTYEEQLKDPEHRTSAQEMSIEPYGEEAATRIWSPTSEFLFFFLLVLCHYGFIFQLSGLIPAEEWSGFYSGPVSNDWPTDLSNGDQITSESESNSSSVAAKPKPSSAFSLVYQEPPKREAENELISSTTASPATPHYDKATIQSNLESESAPRMEFKESSFRRESIEEEVSEYGRRENNYDDYKTASEDFKTASFERKNFGELKVSESSTQIPATSYQYQITSDQVEPKSQFKSSITDPVNSESRDSSGVNVIRALSRIETDQLKHEAVHFNQTNPVVYDPIAKAQSESSYLRHSPLAKHDPFDKKIHSYQYIFGPGPAHNDGKLHSFEETHEYHYPTQYLKRSDRHEHRSSSAPLSVNFKNGDRSDRRTEDDGHLGWKRKAEGGSHWRRDPPGKARLETYFFEGANSRKHVIHEPGSARAESKTVEMDMRDWNGGDGYVSACFGIGCKYRPKSSMHESRSPDLSPIRPFSSFFAPSSSLVSPRFHSVYDDRPFERHYGMPSTPVKSTRYDRGHRSSSSAIYRQSKIPPPPHLSARKPMYKSTPTASFTTRPRVSRYESRHTNADGYRNTNSYRRPIQAARSDVYDYRSDPHRDYSYHGAGSDRDDKFYQPIKKPTYQGSKNNKCDDTSSFEAEGNERHRSRHTYSQSMIPLPEPSPYYGPYQRYFPDLIASSLSSSAGEGDDSLFHTVEDDTPLFNGANHPEVSSNYKYDPLNEGNYFW